MVETVLHRHKLRQERHGLEHRNYRTRRSLAAKHAAPDEAWMASGGLGCYKQATPAELLCPGLIPPETARNQILPGGSSRGRPVRISLRLQRESRMPLGCITQRLPIETKTWLLHPLCWQGRERREKR